MPIINAVIRKIYGKSSSRHLRLINQIPAIIYGNDKSSPLGIILDNNVISNIQTKMNFYDEPLTLLINNKKIKVKVQSTQYHPFKLKLMHIDFILI